MINKYFLVKTWIATEDGRNAQNRYFKVKQRTNDNVFNFLAKEALRKLQEEVGFTENGLILQVVHKSTKKDYYSCHENKGVI
jgi:hypothetical protein